MEKHISNSERLKQLNDLIFSEWESLKSKAESLDEALKLKGEFTGGGDTSKVDYFLGKLCQSVYRTDKDINDFLNEKR